MMTIMLIAIYVISFFTTLFGLCYDELKLRDIHLFKFIWYILISLIPVSNTIITIIYSVMYYFDNVHDIVIFKKRGN